MKDFNENGLRGRDKTQGNLRNAGGDHDAPEGSRRPRKGPLGKDSGRQAQIDDAKEQPQSPGEPAGGE